MNLSRQAAGSRSRVVGVVLPAPPANSPLPVLPSPPLSPSPLPPSSKQAPLPAPSRARKADSPLPSPRRLVLAQPPAATLPVMCSLRSVAQPTSHGPAHRPSPRFSPLPAIHSCYLAPSSERHLQAPPSRHPRLHLALRQHRAAHRGQDHRASPARSGMGLGWAGELTSRQRVGWARRASTSS